MKPIIEIRDLHKSFRRTVALEGLSLSVKAGSVTAFLGPNGAGKTTTIKCMLNLHTADQGTIQVMGCDSRRLGPDVFRQLGYVSENQEMPLWMTVRQFLDYCRPMYPTWDAEFAEKLRRQFDLPPDSTLKALSRGMRMKAALLSSLVYRPKLVVLDEPFSGLDPLVRDEFIRGLLELTEEEGWSVFISSHDIEEVERLADQVAVINQGKLQLDESAEALQARFRTVELLLPGEQPMPKNLPGSWLNPELAKRIVRFTDSSFNESKLTETLSAYFPGAKPSQVTPMSLREIFVALARTYRLNS
jgi:ABC-2 type transport system ATP-binding protein